MSRRNREFKRNPKGGPPTPFYVDPQSQANRYQYLTTSASDRLFRALRRLFGRAKTAK